MSNYYNRQWRLPNEENKSKVSNYSMDFDGNNQYIDLGNSTQVQPVKEMSISAWINASSLATYRGIVSCMYNGSSYDGFALRLDDTSSNKIQFVVNSSTQIKSTSTITTGQWYHLVATYDGANIKLYFNGSLESTTSLTGNIDYTDGSRNTIIGSLYPNVLEFTGKIDGVSIYNYALSSSQITTLYGSSSTGIGNPQSITPNPVAMYNLGDQDTFNGSSYLTPNASLKDYVFDFIPNDYISLNSNISLTGNKTVSVWFKADNISGNNVVIGGSQSPTANYYPYITSTSICLRDSSGFICLTVPAFSNNVWYHLCIVGNGTTATVYIDGQSQGTLNDKSPTINTIGAFSNAASAFDGKLSNAQIFNSALPATGSNSVETLYNNGSPLTSMSGFTSLQGWWKLDASATYDSSTTTWTIEDSSTNSNTGTSSGMTQANLVQSDLSFTSGYSPYALDFDSASSDYIDCGNDSSLNVSTSNHSFSFWLKTTTTSNEVIAQKGNGDELDTQTRPIGSGNVAISWAGFNGYDGTTVINDGNWHNIIFIANGSVSYIYVDGNLDVTGGNKIQSSSNSDSFYIGSRAGLYGFNGSLSNISMWNTALTSAQVTEIYNEGVPSNLNNHSAYSNLVSWWQLGSNSSYTNKWICLDEKGTNNGESVNMTEADIVDGVGSSANGLSSGMGGDEVVGDAPYSSSNSLSVNMDVEDRVTDTPS